MRVKPLARDSASLKEDSFMQILYHGAKMLPFNLLSLNSSLYNQCTVLKAQIPIQEKISLLPQPDPLPRLPRPPGAPRLWGQSHPA